MSDLIRRASFGLLCVLALSASGCRLFLFGPRRHPIAAVAAPLAGAEIVVQQAPPPPREETRPPMPGPGYVWCAGHWAWQGGAHVWVPGRWVVPPRRSAEWIPPHWQHTPGGWRFVPGHW